MNTKHITYILAFYAALSVCHADCPLDHYLIGCNADGVSGTADDETLFVDCSQIYRHSDPDNNAEPTWKYRHYPMYYNERYSRYQIGEPGFDIVQNDPNHQLTGTANTDYQLWVECVSVSSGLTARNTDFGILLDQAGDSFCHSTLLETHLHLQYRLPAAGADITKPYWITYRIIDKLGHYQPSETFTLVFFADPIAGDVVVDGTIDELDLNRWLNYWLMNQARFANDFYFRSDFNYDGIVNLADFAILSSHWIGSVIPE